jgi:hypothetical protein
MRTPPVFLAAAGLALAFGAAAASDAGCSRQSGTQRLRVLELYTSEGCNSCPPADRWLNTLRADTDVLALAFHVDYWDRLGWADPYASPRHTERQYQRQRASGARFVYTPQLLVDGRDWRGWPALPAPSATPAPVALHLARDRAAVTAEVRPRPGQALPARLSGYWVLLEDGLVSQVHAGENAGATLRHNHVVRHYEPLPAWPADQVRQWRLTLPPGGATQAQRAALVVTDADTGLPLQAVALHCGSRPG